VRCLTDCVKGKTFFHAHLSPRGGHTHRPRPTHTHAHIYKYVYTPTFKSVGLARQQLQNIYNEKCQQVFIFMAQHSSVLLLVDSQDGRWRFIFPHWVEIFEEKRAYKG